MWAGHGFFGPLMWIFWILLIVAVVWLLRGAAGGGEDRPAPRRPTPLEILEERLARGEIDEQEFERRRRLLEK